MHTGRKIFIAWVAVLLWMGCIFYASTDTFSAAQTSRVIVPLLRWLFGHRLSMTSIEQIHFYVRKSAHVTEYAVLAVLMWNALRRSFPPLREPFAGWMAVLFAACHAALDEFHQSFVPSRTASVRDVLIDTTGAMLGVVLLLRIRHLRSLLLRRRSAADLPRPVES